jgi:hypothetical protein
VLNLWVSNEYGDTDTTLNITGNVSGTGGLLINKNGTVNLTGDNSNFSGNVTLSNGTLNTNLIAVGAHSEGTFRNSGGTHNMAGHDLYVGTYDDGTGRYELSGSGASLTTRDLFLGNAGDGTFEQTDGTGSVSHNMYLGYWPGGEGTYNLSDGTMTIGNSLYIGGKSDAAGGSGTVNISGGQLNVNGSVKIWDDGELNLTGGELHVANILGDITNTSGSLCPGFSPGLLTINGDYTQGTSALLEIELGGVLRGDEYDALFVTGTMNLAGTLDVVLWNGFEPLAGNSFDILDWGHLNGTFDIIDLPALNPGLMWNTSALYTSGQLSVTPEPATICLLGLGGLAMLRRKRCSTVSFI